MLTISHILARRYSMLMTLWHKVILSSHYLVQILIFYFVDCNYIIHITLYPYI